MAQLVEYGRRLAPWIAPDAQRQLAEFVINYARNNPQQIARMGQQVRGWIVENVPRYAQTALQMGEAIANRIADDWADVGGELRAHLDQGRANLDDVRHWEDLQGDNEIDNMDIPNEVAVDQNGELIRENPRQPAGGNMEVNGNGRRPAAGPPEGEPEAQRFAGGGAGGNNSVSKETPISRYPTLTYGFQETHTTILPWCGYISTTGMNHALPNVLEIRMTQPHDMIKTTIQGLAAGGTWGKDFYNVPYNDNATRDTATAAEFPAAMDTGAANTERPSYWQYYRQMYEYYTVLGCEYEILIDNPGSQQGTEVVVGWDYNAYSATSGATGNITPPDQPLNTMKQYKGLQWKTIPIASSDAGEKNKIMLKGTYHAGDARRNVANDNEVRTWHKTNSGGTAEAVNLIELLTLYFYRWELAYFKPANRTLGVNMQIKLKYIVQFKDLLRPFRYPNTVDTAIDLIASTDVQQFPL